MQGETPHMSPITEKPWTKIPLLGYDRNLFELTEKSIQGCSFLVVLLLVLLIFLNFAVGGVFKGTDEHLSWVLLEARECSSKDQELPC